MPRPSMRPVTAIIGCRFSREISGWPVTGSKPRNPMQRKYMSVGRADRQFGQCRLAQLQCIGQTDAHTDGLGRLRQLRRDRSGQCRIHRAGYVVGGHALDAGADRIDLQIERVTRQPDAALHLDHAVDLADGGRDLFGLRHQRSSVWPYSLISIGCGTAVRSPIRSSISCASSTSTPGTWPGPRPVSPP